MTPILTNHGEGCPRGCIVYLIRIVSPTNKSTAEVTSFNNATTPILSVQDFLFYCRRMIDTISDLSKEEGQQRG